MKRNLLFILLLPLAANSQEQVKGLYGGLSESSPSMLGFSIRIEKNYNSPIHLRKDHI